MLEDIMNRFAFDTNSVMVRAIVSHQKTIRDLAAKYPSMDDDLFSQVYVICVYNAQKQSYTVNFNDDNMIGMYSMISNRTSFSKKRLVELGFLQYSPRCNYDKITISSQYTINRQCYELLQEYRDTLMENYRIHLRFINRNKNSRWSSILAIDEVLCKYGAGPRRDRNGNIIE